MKDYKTLIESDKSVETIIKESETLGEASFKEIGKDSYKMGRVVISLYDGELTIKTGPGKSVDLTYKEVAALARFVNNF